MGATSGCCFTIAGTVAGVVAVAVAGVDKEAVDVATGLLRFDAGCC